MKRYRVILLAFLILLGMSIFGISGYISCLQEQNNVLANNIGQIMKRITALETNKMMEQVNALRAENIVLKKQIENLKVELSQVSQKVSLPQSQEISQVTSKEKIPTGNKGFLLKGGKSIQ